MRSRTMFEVSDGTDAARFASIGPAWIFLNSLRLAPGKIATLDMITVVDEGDRTRMSWEKIDTRRAETPEVYPIISYGPRSW